MIDREDERARPSIGMCFPTAVDFWADLDSDVLRCLAERHGQMTPAEIGHTLGLSEQAVRSIVGMLAEAGKVRIMSVERVA